MPISNKVYGPNVLEFLKDYLHWVVLQEIWYNNMILDPIFNYKYLTRYILINNRQIYLILMKYLNLKD